MIKRILFVLALTIGVQQLKAQSIHVRKSSYGKGYRVCIVDQPYKADLLVHRVGFQWEAQGNKGLWKFVDKPWQADYLIILVDNPWQADLTIFFCRKPWQAGWRNMDVKRELSWKN